MIICSNCNKVLDGKDPHTVEKKLCISCVQGTSKAADLSKLITPEGRGSEGGISIEERFKSMELTFDYEFINGECKVVFKLKDYFKKPFFSFALGTKELEDFQADIYDIEQDALEKPEE